MSHAPSEAGSEWFARSDSTFSPGPYTLNIRPYTPRERECVREREGERERDRERERKRERERERDKAGVSNDLETEGLGCRVQGSKTKNNEKWTYQTNENDEYRSETIRKKTAKQKKRYKGETKVRHTSEAPESETPFIRGPDESLNPAPFPRAPIQNNLPL